MRVAHLNMTDPSSQCPVGFRVETANNTRFCIRDTSSAGCGSMLFEPFGLTYSQVCGYVRGYSYGSTDAFAKIKYGGNHVDGVSIAYGTPPTYIWIYAAGNSENTLESPHKPNCPCNTPGTNPPSYVGSSYYCESVSINSPTALHKWHTSDPLWDGMQCGGDEGPCCNHTGLPWFNKNTPTSTTATINVRVCLDEDSDNENIGIKRLELYIK